MNINYNNIIKMAIGIAVLTTLLVAGAVAQSNGVSADVYKKIQDASAQLQDALQPSGRLEASGTHFELNNSRYLNITMDSSAPIRLALESIPEMVTMHIESDSDAISTQINLSGFARETTYHKYEDDYHNHIVFTTDANGNYTYTQDISGKHIVFIQPRASTKFINDTGGDCALIGTWNAITSTCKLNTNLIETIQIDSDNITLDGDGHASTGSGTGSGVYLPGRIGVTVRNMNIEQFATGILLNNNSINNNVTGNNALNNSDTGIFLDSSNNNMLSGNNAANNTVGIGLNSSSNNTLSCNDASNNAIGIGLVDSNNNTLSGNNASNNAAHDFSIGIVLVDSNNNTLSSNNALNNTGSNIGIGIGIVLEYSNNNTLRGNNASYNSGNIGGTNFGIGIALGYSNNNTLSDNNASNNAIGIVFAPGFEAVLLAGGLIAAYCMKRGRRRLR